MTIEQSPIQPSLPFPWHNTVVTALLQAWQAQRLPHAVILHGIEGLGKRALAHWLAQGLLCRSPISPLQPCHQCPACKQIAAGTHPDLFRIEPETDKLQISVDTVRTVCEQLTLTSSGPGYRVVLLYPAHQMTINAANSMLKSLEEPGRQVLWILITPKLSAVLATLRSRCQCFGIHRPTAAVAQHWLQQQGQSTTDVSLLNFVSGAPLKALQYATEKFEQLQNNMHTTLQELLAGHADVTKVARTWNDEYVLERLNWLDGWVCSLIRKQIVKTDDQVTQALYGGLMSLPIQSQPLNISGVYSCLDRLRELKAQLFKIALQRELALEYWLIGMLHALRTQPH